jgi:hypothetical protein
MSDNLEEPPKEHEALQPTPTGVDPCEVNKPSRKRRTYYVFVTTFVAYVTCVLFGVYGSGKIAEMVADGLISLMMMTSLTYITAYSIDSSEVLRKIGDRVSSRGDNV